MAALDDLLLELMDAPTDDDFLVYADAASMLGDPRGELVIRCVFAAYRADAMSVRARRPAARRPRDAVRDGRRVAQPY